MGTIEDEQPEAPRVERRRRCCCSWPFLIVLLLVLAGGGFLGWYFRQHWWPSSSSSNDDESADETINPTSFTGRQTTRIQLQLDGISEPLVSDEKEVFETACQDFFAEQLADRMETVQCKLMGRRRLQASSIVDISVWVAVSGKPLAEEPIAGFAVLAQVIVAKSYRDFVDKLQSSSDFFSSLIRIEASTSGNNPTTGSPTVSPTVAFQNEPTATPTSVSTGGGAVLPQE